MNEPRKLTREQARAIREALRRNQRLLISALTLVEIVLLCGLGKRIRIPAVEVLRTIAADDRLGVVPVDIEVALEMADLGEVLPDPTDRTIVATARVHHLRLLTSDQRIIDSNLTEAVT